MKYQVACFSQMDVMSSRIEGNPDAVLGGACHCFSIHWLRLVLSDSGELPKDRLAKIKRSGGGLNLLMNNIYRVRYDPREMIESDQMLFRLRGLKPLCPTIDISGYSFSQFCREPSPNRAGRDRLECVADRRSAPPSNDYAVSDCQS